MAAWSRERQAIVLHCFRALGVDDATALVDTDADGVEYLDSEQTLELMQWFSSEQKRSG